MKLKKQKKNTNVWSSQDCSSSGSIAISSSVQILLDNSRIPLDDWLISYHSNYIDICGLLNSTLVWVICWKSPPPPPFISSRWQWPICPPFYIQVNCCLIYDHTSTLHPLDTAIERNDICDTFTVKNESLWECDIQDWTNGLSKFPWRSLFNLKGSHCILCWSDLVWTQDRQPLNLIWGLTN